jgi:hypothetical protein
MDLSQPISYRGFTALNGATLQTGRVLRGITVENVDYSNVEAVGYTEKRAASDGLHASDIYYGARHIDMNGLIYAPSLAEMFDFLHILRSVFSPTSAYQEAPGDQGFLPLEFSQPTTDTTSFPGSAGPPVLAPGVIPLYIKVRPVASPRFSIARDRQSSNGTRSTTTPWAVRLLAKDPRVYIDPDKVIDVSGPLVPSGAINTVAVNRGDYETPMNVILVIGATAPGAGQFFVTQIGSAKHYIYVEQVPNVIYRWFGNERVLMTQDVSGGVTTNPYVLRQDLVAWEGKNTRLMVPASINPPSRPFSTPLFYYRNVTLAAGSRLFWSEAFA